MVYVAFVIDAFSRITGWRAATTMTITLVLDALDHAVWTRARHGVAGLAGLVHYTDAGSQPPRSPSPDGCSPPVPTLP
jgi:putative transposase